MNLSTKRKLPLSLALAACLCAPLNSYAANSGGEISNGNYIGNNGTSSNNTVQIDTVTKGLLGVIGGQALDANNANNNKVTIGISNATIEHDVYGGYSVSGEASGNVLTINSGEAKVDVYGGYSDIGATLDNKVVFNGTTVGVVYGGKALTKANQNNVLIKTGTIQYGVYGGISLIDKAENNTVTIADGIINGDVAGGVGDNGAANNTVNIIGGQMADGVFGGQSDNAFANSNKVNISNGTITMVYAGLGQTVANNNLVTISGGTLLNVFAGKSLGGESNNNQIIMTGGTVNDMIIVGEGYTVANGNSIIINGGNINAVLMAAIGDSTASNNTITIMGNANISPRVNICGGYAKNSQNNTLNIYKSGVSLNSVSYIQNYDLALDKNNTTLTVADELIINSDDVVKSTKALSLLHVGDQVNVLESKDILDTSQATLKNGIAKHGILYEYAYEYSIIDNNKLVANIKSKSTTAQASNLPTGQLAAMGMLRSGADMVAGSAMNNAAKSETEYDVFGALNYTNISMDSVSSVDVQGSSMLVGMGRNVKHSNSNTTLGAFLEAGWGTYESSTGLAHANGHTNYYGIGVLARNNNDNGVYTEGSIRVGKVGNTYSGRTVADGSYDVSSTYYGAHIGIGKINKINEKTSTDIYAKYFYAHEGGTSANIAGDNFDFNSIDSHRVRIGGRLNSMNKNINRYVGLAYEYEFGGKANATAYGKDIASPTAKGSSGILELGLVYKPAPDSKFSMDMGVNGYAGKRKGVTGNVTLNWGF